MERLISKLFAGNCSREELLELLNMLQQGNKQPAPEVMERLWQELRDIEKLPSQTSQKIYADTLRQMASVPPKQKTFQRYWIAAAASVAILIGLYFLLPLVFDKTIRVETSFAEQKQVELPDGSMVTLNANSTLSYAKYWSDRKNRRVWLRGEAFFKVARKESTKQKFEVNTEDLTIEVLGTSFNVNTHQERTKVFLEEGSIKLKLEDRPETLLLKPGDLFSYSQKTRETSKEITELQLPSSWKDGIVILKNVELKTILEKINEIYGLDYRVTDPNQLERVFNIGIPVDNSETMLFILQETVGKNIIIENNELKIK